MKGWKAKLDTSLPCWRDYASLLGRLRNTRFPDCAALGSLLPEGLATASGHPVRFRPARELPAAPYEQHIHATGEVSTRECSWHDLFNALVWARMPALKVAMNARHCSAGQFSARGARGPLRDALTLFDECGAIVASSQGDLLGALAGQCWNAALRDRRAAWTDEATLVVTGHAMLEKFLDPYKAMTANVLLVATPPGFHSRPREKRLAILDASLAAAIAAGAILHRPACLSPLPLMGVPGMWPGTVQDAAFYRDEGVFRPARPGSEIAPVLRLGDNGMLTRHA